MKVGLFDHIENAGTSLSQLFDERLKLAQAADQLGFYALHLAEHHATPLNMVPVPGVFLGALSRLTRNLRLGPLTYLLPLYSPLRMAEEICMLDHMSHGRLEVGVGRGVSPFELKYHKVDAAQSRAIFTDAYECVREALTHDELTYKGPFYEYDKVPIALRPMQEPHPPFWYGSSGAEGSTWAGEQGLHFVTLGPTPMATANIATYREAFARHGKPASPKTEFPGGVAIGVQRHIFVDDTDEAAVSWAKPAMDKHIAHLNWIRTRHGVSSTDARIGRVRGANFEESVADGTVIAGSPATVRAEIERQLETIGANYLLAYVCLGDMKHETAMRSMNLLAKEVMPAIEQL